MGVELTAVIRFERESDVPTQEEFDLMLETLDVDANIMEYEEEEV